MLERDALFTRTGHGGVAQIGTRGAIAACFDHWDTRAGDPNLHTHVVVANKVQGADGRWRSVDSRALHHAAVALSELYDDLLADRLTRWLGVRWGWRDRGPRRTPAFEIDGIEDPLLARVLHPVPAHRDPDPRPGRRRSAAGRARPGPGRGAAAAAAGHPGDPTGEDAAPAAGADRRLAAPGRTHLVVRAQLLARATGRRSRRLRTVDVVHRDRADRAGRD